MILKYKQVKGGTAMQNKNYKEIYLLGILTFLLMAST